MARSIIHKSDSRGVTNLGWLHSRHTFSFGDYYHPERIHFGALRVINDDLIAPGRGFGNHPHSDMEIITIPLEGELEHKDSMNNYSVVARGDIQIMSAGTGVFHSEYNNKKDATLKMLQIWVVPKVKGVKPRYDQLSFEFRDNDFTEFLSPDLHDESLWVFQDVWFYYGKLEAGRHLDYFLKETEINGVYVYVINGEVSVNNETLTAGDGLGLWEISEIQFDASENSDFLVIEVPMKI